ncbi:MAG TPA: hypothetical protein VF120_14450 [Ktedonobacterales bacterium]
MDSIRPFDQPHAHAHRRVSSTPYRRQTTSRARSALEAALERAVQPLFPYAKFDEIELDACTGDCIVIYARFRSPAPRSEAIARGPRGRTRAAALLEDAIVHVVYGWYGSAWVEDVRVERSGHKMICSFVVHSSTHDEG